MAMPTTSRRRGAPARTSHEEVLDAALDIVDRHGLDALSLRAVAGAVGVTPMSLYRHVDGVDGLLDMVVSRLIERSGGIFAATGTWREAVVAYGHALRRLISEHPAYLNAVLRRPIANRPALTAMDGLLGSLRRAGLSPQAAADSYLTLYSFCVGFAAMEQGRAESRDRDRLAGRITGAPLGETLTSSGFPHLTEAAAFLAPGFDDARFSQALEVICAGIATACSDPSLA